jgi:hypothetical protein
MTIETYVARVLRYLSILFFLIALFLCYSNLPDLVAVHFAPSGQADGFLGRDSLFYATGGVMLAFNVLLLVLARRFAALPDRAVEVFGPTTWRAYPEALRRALGNWLLLGAAALNVFLGLCLNALSELNDAEPTETVFDYRWLLGLGAGLLLAWLLYLPVRFGLTKPSLRERML